jgi:mono/diheme cytochrome c family protein
MRRLHSIGLTVSIALAGIAACSQQEQESGTNNEPVPFKSRATSPAPEPEAVRTTSPPDAGSKETGSDAPGQPSVEITEATLELGAKAYQTGMCWKCHRGNGKGGQRGPDLTDNEWLHCDGSIDGILEVLRSGVSRNQFKDPNRPFEMNPATNFVQDNDQLAALATYVFNLSQPR